MNKKLSTIDQDPQKFVHLEEGIFAKQNDEFHVKTANTLEEACKILGVGFEYVTDMAATTLQGEEIMKTLLWTNPRAFSTLECEGWDSNPYQSGDVSRKSPFSI